jgi:hypothetical protein
MAEIVRVAGPEVVIGRNVLEFMHPDYREFVTARILKSAADGAQLPPAEEKLVAADGTVLDVKINTAPITYLEEPCAMAIVQDITARKNAEAELKAAHLQLLLVNAGLPSETYNAIGNGLPFFQGRKDFGQKYPTTAGWCSNPSRIAEAGDVLMSVRAPVGDVSPVRSKDIQD